MKYLVPKTFVMRFLHIFCSIYTWIVPRMLLCLPLLIIIIQKICSAHISTLLGTQGAYYRNTGASPFSFTISVLGSFTCITQHTGPTALRPIRRTNQLWLSVLLKDTSAATGQAGIRTHIMTTPELESNAPDRSALLHFLLKVIPIFDQNYPKCWL